MRQWGRGQTAAESRQTRGPLRGRRGVNGAAAKRPRKDALPFPARTERVMASMGPRPNGRGKEKHREAMRRGYLRQWGRGQTAAESVAALDCAADGAARQWGRGQTAAESLNPPPEPAASCCASMGPRPNGRGKGAASTPTSTTPKSVNGAAAKRPRKVAAGIPQALQGPEASMGPRPNGRGKLSQRRRGARAWCVNGAAAKRPRKDAYLTCPHVKTGASMGPRPNGRGKGARGVEHAPAPKASMGPRPNGRGKVPALQDLGIVPVASMGPRPNGRGKNSPSGPSIPRRKRQWGRGQTAAESAMPPPRFEGLIRRQWGRGQTAAERLG